MRLLLRVVGTLLIALAVILLIIDGTKSLAVNAFVTTALSDIWLQLNPQSLAAVKEFVETRLFGPVLGALVSTVLGFPAWVDIGVPGVLLAWAGRSRRTRLFVRQDQI